MKAVDIITLFSALLFIVGCNTDGVGNAETNTQAMNTIFAKGQQGPAENFTGTVWNTQLVENDSVFTTVAGNVHFEAGARTNWHSHPAGQLLIVVDGEGRHQIEGQPVEVIKKGDAVKCSPNVNHWHGAAPGTHMQHVYIVPNTEKGIVNWGKPVTDEEYLAK